ncbi:MAG: HAMP domain-containing histidine kinase [Kouleothrix sp.]|nr:HAMP domain-containing histidine kinase [Kouleothrix sp.]
MKLRLFWTILLTFALVIGLGICGMLGFVGLTFAGVWQPSAMRESLQEAQSNYAAILGDYYAANGDSWAGVDRRLDNSPFVGPPSFFGYALADASGRIVASDDRTLPIGRVADQVSLTRGAPVEARGERVGTLVLRAGSRLGANAPIQGRRPIDLIWPVVRGFLFAGLVLGGGLLLLAVFFAQRLSRPLRDITVAAQRLATGQLDVQVRRAPIREIDELTQAFNAMARSLAESDRQRRQMTADIAHELRTPLTIIKGRLEGLQDGVYSATTEELDRLLHETALLERLIEDLRLLALAETGQLPLYRELLDPREMIEEARAAFAGQAAAHGVELRLAAGDELPPIDADPQRLAQVLGNLISNALRYTAEGGAITLGARRMKAEGGRVNASIAPLQLIPHPSSFILFEVIDTGQGIAAEDVPHIFDRFYRADRSRTRGSGGAGLGLAIAKQIVAAHGGAIWAESQEGRGTTISIALPAGESNGEERSLGRNGRN